MIDRLYQKTFLNFSNTFPQDQLINFFWTDLYIIKLGEKNLQIFFKKNTLIMTRFKYQFINMLTLLHSLVLIRVAIESIQGIIKIYQNHMYSDYFNNSLSLATFSSLLKLSILI